MPLFSIEKEKLNKISKVHFKLEREIQKITEDNLETIFGLEFVQTEFQLNNLRMDTLAFDNESNSFVIIEYKRGTNFSVIDQGYAYLALLLNNKADFILEYNETKKNLLRKNDVDWSQSRVMFVAPEFTNYQRQAIEFKDLPIELWEISKYNNGTILFNRLKAPSSSESITTVSSRSKVVNEVSKEVQVYTEETHLINSNPDIKELYEEMKNRTLDLDSNIEIKPFVKFLGYKLEQYFVSFALRKTMLKIWLNLSKGELNDPRKMARDVSKVGHSGSGDYEISLTPDDDLDYAMTLIKQAYNKLRP